MGNGLLLVKVVTDLHNGSGQGLGQVDRAIIRERKTQFPYIQAATIKGNFRAEFKLRGIADGKKLDVLCGDESPGGSEHRGFIEFTDAMLFALPVRSLRGAFVWATTPLAIARLERWWKLVKPGLTTAAPVLHEPLSAGTLLAPTGAATDLVHGGHVFLEEYAFTCTEKQSVSALASELAGYLWSQNDWWAKRFPKALVVLHEDDFGHFVRHATEVVANIRIESEGEHAGTTRDGSLRYTEYLPQESLLFSLVEIENVPPQLQTHLNGGAPLGLLQDLVRTQDKSLFQLGGDETKGKGLVEFSFVAGGQS